MLAAPSYYRLMERRSEARSPVVLEVQIIGPGLQLACRVRDVSEHGARIRVGDAQLVPECFDLYFVIAKERRAAAVRWRGAEELGVSFAPEQKPSFGRRKQRT